jgi:gamma-carbonic anhydrase
MAIIKKLQGKDPKIGKDVFIAENASIIGDVTIGEACSIWFGAVLRGDVQYIKIGNEVNIQDNVVVHGTYKKHATNIGDRVSIAHGAIIHGCTIHDDVLIGINAVISDGAIIESNSIVAVGAVVPKGMIVKSGTVVGGIPAKKIKEVDADLLNGEIKRISKSYKMYSSWYK